jgi:hypothetical protein
VSNFPLASFGIQRGARILRTTASVSIFYSDTKYSHFHTLTMDLSAILSSPTILPLLPEIPNTPDISTPLSRATTQSWDSQNGQNGPHPDGSLVTELDSQSSRSSLSNCSTEISPAPSTPTHRHNETSRDKRLMIQTALLFKIPYKEICRVLDVIEYQIWRVKHHRLTPQKARKQQSKLKTPQKSMLREWLHSSLSHRRIPYLTIFMTT